MTFFSTFVENFKEPRKTGHPASIMNLYINIPYKTGEHKLKEKHSFHSLYIKISISPHFFRFLLNLCSAGPVEPHESRGVSHKNAHIYSKHKHAKSEDKPYRYNFKVLASKTRMKRVDGEKEGEILQNQSTFNNGAYKSASRVLNTFFSLLFDFIFLA